MEYFLALSSFQTISGDSKKLLVSAEKQPGQFET